MEFVLVGMGLILLAFLVAIFVFWRNGSRKGFDLKSQEYLQEHWERILAVCERNPKEAILDADKLLDYGLKRKGFQGTLGEKLKKAGPRFSDLNGVWKAHKLRNRVAHEMGEIPLAEAKEALRNFKKALNDLGAGL